MRAAKLMVTQEFRSVQSQKKSMKASKIYDKERRKRSSSAKDVKSTAAKKISHYCEPNCDKNGQKLAQNSRESLGIRNIKAEKSSDSEAPHHSSSIILEKDMKRESEVPRKDTQDKKHQVKRKVKKESNTLLAMFQDSSDSSDSDIAETKIDNDLKDSDANDAEMKIEDGTESSDTDRVEMKINENSSSSDEDDAGMKSGKHTKHSGSGRFDLEAEAKDIEELISNLEAEEQIPKETVRKLHRIRVTLKHDVPPQHQVETCAGSRGPTKKQKEVMEKFGPIKRGSFTPEEDAIIVKNWKSFCKMHDWDIRDVQPFLYMRHQYVGFMAKFSERQKFVQFLAAGLPWRSLYSVYWRFRTMYRPHLNSRYTVDEDNLIIAYMQNSSAVNEKNVRKFSQLAKVLNRTRASVWRRYQLLSKKKKYHERIKWDVHSIKKFIKNLMHLTLCGDVQQLKDLSIPLVVWKKLSEKLKMDAAHLKRFWVMKLHMQLFCKGPIYLNDIKIKLIEYLYVNGITQWWEVEWPNIVKHFDGMTSAFLSGIFRDLVDRANLGDKELSEILKYFYEVKKPLLQQAAKDKYLPRLVFKNGAVKVIEASAKIEDYSD